MKHEHTECDPTLHNAVGSMPEMIGTFNISKYINRADKNLGGVEGCWDYEVGAEQSDVRNSLMGSLWLLCGEQIEVRQKWKL